MTTDQTAAERALELLEKATPGRWGVIVKCILCGSYHHYTKVPADQVLRGFICDGCINSRGAWVPILWPKKKGYPHALD